MGRNTTTPLPQSLDRFSIGEVVDISGVANFYDAGTSKWLKSATLTASSNLPATTKTSLANAGTSSVPTVIARSSLSESYITYGFYASYPIERISASSVSVVPAYYNGTTAVGVGAITSAGMQLVPTGQTSIRTSDGGAGTNVYVAGNGTTIFSYTFTSATALSAYYTTNGTTWTAGSVTGLPTFAVGTDTPSHASTVANSIDYTTNTAAGWRRGFSSGNGQFAVFWCGARFLLVAHGATNYLLSLSTDGLSFGGDNTTAVIGATAQAKAVNMQFYRNGNNCYLNIGTAYRYSTDGGVTWAASTFAGAPSPTTYAMLINLTDPAKMVITPSTATTTAYYSADSGATWSASRPWPFTNPHGVYYKGNTIIATNGASNIKVSTDNGTTWVTPTFPVGVLGTLITFFGDTNRFYAGVDSQAQLLTSSDAVTWTLVTLAQNFNVGYQSTWYGAGIVAYDSNTVVLIGYNTANGQNQCFFTLDGGVTWTGAAFTTGGASFWAGNSSFVTPDGGGIGFAFSSSSLNTTQNANVLKADIAAGGAFYRTGSSTIAPLRTNALAYVRVG
jgi:hypothetical protein